MPSSESQPLLSPKSPPFLPESKVRALAAASGALAEYIGDLATANFAKLLAESAGAYADSPRDLDAVARLADSAAEFMVFFMNQEADDPQVTEAIKDVLLAAADVLPPVRHLAPAPPCNKTQEKKPKTPCKIDPSTFADATAVLAAELHGTGLAGIATAFAYHASKFASAPDDVEVKVLLTLEAMLLDQMATGTQHARRVSDLTLAAGPMMHTRRPPSFLRRVLARFGPGSTAKPGDEDWTKNHLEEVDRLQKWTSGFAEAAAKSSMADEAAAFSHAVDGLAGSWHDKDAGAAYGERLRMELLLRMPPSPPLPG